MKLVFDIGNSLSKYALFQEGELVYRRSEKNFSNGDLEWIFENYDVDAAIISSVTGQNDFLNDFIRTKTNTIVLDQSTPLPISNQYGTPGTLGNDRIASVVGASGTFPHQNILVIDAGTCIKYDFISAEGIYHGGAISPGLFMRFEAMHNYTARLPLISPEQLKEAKELIFNGNSTVASLIAGGATGLVLEASGFIGRYEETYPDLRVVCTGGDAPFFELHLKRRIFALPDLVLFGLNIILEHNLKQT